MSQGYEVDPDRLQAVSHKLRERQDAAQADPALGAAPDVGRSTNETSSALDYLRDAGKNMGTSLENLAQALDDVLANYRAGDDAVAQVFGGSNTLIARDRPSGPRRPCGLPVQSPEHRTPRVARRNHDRHPDYRTFGCRRFVGR